MPTDSSWTDPEELVVHKGITVWHCYKDADTAHGRLTYQFTVDELCDGVVCECIDSETCYRLFDVRNYGYREPRDTVEALKAFVVKMIDDGVLTKEGVKPKEAADGAGREEAQLDREVPRP